MARGPSAAASMVISLKSMPSTSSQGGEIERESERDIYIERESERERERDRRIYRGRERSWRESAS